MKKPEIIGANIPSSLTFSRHQNTILFIQSHTDVYAQYKCQKILRKLAFVVVGLYAPALG